MGEPVCLKSISSCTLVVALIADEGLLTTVGEHVVLEVCSFCAGIIALVAAEGFLSTML